MTTIPILPSAHLEDTARFYSGLGFDTTGFFPGEYLVLVHSGGAELHFFLVGQRHRRGKNDHGAYLRLSDPGAADRLHERWSGPVRAAGGALHPPADTDYGLREFAIVDPDGNLLRVGAPLSATDTDPEIDE